MKNCYSIQKAYVAAVMAFLTFAMILASVPIASAAGAITLTPTTQTPGVSVTVHGTGFGANQAVGIGFGAETNVTNENMIIDGPFDVANGPYVGYASYAPIKPGTFTMSINVTSTVFAAVDIDFGNGTLGDLLSIFLNGTLNYATGQRTRFTKSPVSSATYYLHLVNYTCYQYSVTPAAGVTTNSLGEFTASIIVPGVANGVYTVTAVDTQGHTATAPLTVASTASMWSMTYGGAGNDIGTGETIQTSDGGYAISGDTNSSGAGGLDFWLIKTDATGNMIWNKTYGGALDETSGEMCQTTDGGYALAGGTESFGAGDSDFWLVRTDADGRALWAKAYGGTGYEYAMSVVQTLDRGYLLLGVTESFGAGGQDFYLVKTDESGNMQWSKTYGGNGTDYGTSVVQSSDGGYALAGYTGSFGAGATDYWLVKTDASGNMQWNMTYGGTGMDQTYQLKRTSDGGYAMTGYSSSFGGFSAYLVKTDSAGNMEWNMTYWSPSMANSLTQTMDGGFALAGFTSTGGEDIYVAKTDASGNMEWNMTYGGTGSDRAYSIIQTSDGGYALTGWTTSFGAGGQDFWLVKTDGLGVVPEGLTIGVMLLLSTVAVIVGVRYFRKRPKWQNW